MDCEFASVIAIKVVEDAIEYVEGCGSPPRVALIQTPVGVPPIVPPGEPRAPNFGYSPPHSYSYYTEPVVIFPQEKIGEIAKIIASVERQTKGAQNKKIHKAMRSETDKLLKDLMKDLYE
jgi:hypothetical protein